MSITFFIPNFACVLTNIDRKHIEQNFHSVAGIMHQGWDGGAGGGVKNFIMGICDGAPSTAHSSFILALLITLSLAD